MPQQNNVSIQTSLELFDAGCQTRTKPIRFLGAPFQVDDCEEVAKSGSTATRFTQTVTVIRNTSWQKIISNPHPDTVQEILSKKKVRKPQLSVHQKAVRWWDCDKKEALQKYKSVEPIELPCNEDELTSDIPALKRLVMMLGVRTSMYEVRNMYLERQLNSINDKSL